MVHKVAHQQKPLMLPVEKEVRVKRCESQAVQVETLNASNTIIAVKPLIFCKKPFLQVELLRSNRHFLIQLLLNLNVWPKLK